MRRLSSLGVLCLAAASACEGATEPPAGVAVEAVVSPIVVSAGSEVNMSVKITNASTNTYRVPGSGGGCIATFRVHTEAGKEVPAFDPRICDAAAAQHPLPPGASRTDQLRWLVPGDLAPGRYRVRAAVGVVECCSIWSAFTTVEVR